MQCTKELEELLTAAKHVKSVQMLVRWFENDFFLGGGGKCCRKKFKMFGKTKNIFASSFGKFDFQQSAQIVHSQCIV